MPEVERETSIVVIPASLVESGKVGVPINTVLELQASAGSLKKVIDALLGVWSSSGKPDKPPPALLHYWKHYDELLVKIHKLTEGAQMENNFKKADIMVRLFEFMGDMPLELKQRLVEYMESANLVSNIDG